jgi:hypothetical protein
MASRFAVKIKNKMSAAKAVREPQTAMVALIPISPAMKPIIGEPIGVPPMKIKM